MIKIKIKVSLILETACGIVAYGGSKPDKNWINTGSLNMDFNQ